MIICLSSGSRERYRQDIILSLAMPENHILQFRYDTNWVSPVILEKLRNKSIINEMTLIAYIDQSDKRKTPELIPCRLAKITDASIHGRTVSFQFNLKEFEYAKDIGGFNRELHSLSGGTIADWDENKKPKGYYCIWIENNNLSTIDPSNKLTIWENIVSQIAIRNDFLNEKCFYMIENLINVRKRDVIKPSNGVYKLESFHEYELNIYHYHPSEGKSKAYLLCEPQTQCITPLTNSKLLVNSRYDIKHFRFLTAKVITTTRTLLSMYRGTGESKDEIPVLDFDLNLQIKSNCFKKTIIGIMIGLAIAAPHVTAAFSNNQLGDKSKYVITTVAIIASVFAGIIVSFNLKKDV